MVGCEIEDEWIEILRIMGGHCIFSQRLFLFWQDVVLAELMSTQRDWIVDYHEHDSLLENRPEENLSEEEIKAAWEDYEREKQGIFQYRPYNYTPNPNFGLQAASTSAAVLPGMGQFGVPRLPFTTQISSSGESALYTFTLWCISVLWKCYNLPCQQSNHVMIIVRGWL